MSEVYLSGWKRKVVGDKGREKGKEEDEEEEDEAKEMEKRQGIKCQIALLTWTLQGLLLTMKMM